MPVIGALKKFLSFRGVVALTLMFWCAGTGCMILSYARGGDTEAAVAEASSSAAEDMAGMPACHAHRQKNQEVAKSQTSAADSVGQLNLPRRSRSGAMNCCPLTNGSITAASRVQSNDTAPAISNTDSQLLNLLPSVKGPVAIPLRLPNRAHSYLLDCAFLI